MRFISALDLDVLPGEAAKYRHDRFGFQRLEDYVQLRLAPLLKDSVTVDPKDPLRPEIEQWLRTQYADLLSRTPALFKAEHDEYAYVLWSAEEVIFIHDHFLVTTVHHSLINPEEHERLMDPQGCLAYRRKRTNNPLNDPYLNLVFADIYARILRVAPDVFRPVNNVTSPAGSKIISASAMTIQKFGGSLAWNSQYLTSKSAKGAGAYSAINAIYSTEFKSAYWSACGATEAPENDADTQIHPGDDVIRAAETSSTSWRGTAAFMQVASVLSAQYRGLFGSEYALFASLMHKKAAQLAAVVCAHGNSRFIGRERKTISDWAQVYLWLMSAPDSDALMARMQFIKLHPEMAYGLALFVQRRLSTALTLEGLIDARQPLGKHLTTTQGITPWVYKASRGRCRYNWTSGYFPGGPGCPILNECRLEQIYNLRKGTPPGAVVDDTHKPVSLISPLGMSMFRLLEIYGPANVPRSRDWTIVRAVAQITIPPTPAGDAYIRPPKETGKGASKNAWSVWRKLAAQYDVNGKLMPFKGSFVTHKTLQVLDAIIAAESTFFNSFGHPNEQERSWKLNANNSRLYNLRMKLIHTNINEALKVSAGKPKLSAMAITLAKNITDSGSRGALGVLLLGHTSIVKTHKFSREWHQKIQQFNQARQQMILLSKPDDAEDELPLAWPELFHAYSEKGYDISPLNTQDDLIANGVEMGHCVGSDTYTIGCMSGDRRIFSITQTNEDGKNQCLATGEIRISYPTCGDTDLVDVEAIPTLTSYRLQQLQGPNNKHVSDTLKSIAADLVKRLNTKPLDEGCSIETIYQLGLQANAQCLRMRRSNYVDYTNMNVQSVLFNAWRWAFPDKVRYAWEKADTIPERNTIALTWLSQRMTVIHDLLDEIEAVYDGLQAARMAA